jgi:hypothetical protein
MKLRQKELFVSLACLLSLIFLVGSAFASNLVVNGDFESGNTGFTSGYTYVSTTGPFALYPEGDYTVGNNPIDYHNLWTSFTPIQGTLMMIVNGDPNAGVIVWEQTVTVLPDTDYYFSAYAASNFDTNPAVLNFSINGGAIGSITPSTTPGDWGLFFATWNSGSNTTADLALVNENTIREGNDFSLDGVSMDTVLVPVPPTMLLMGSGLLGLVGLRLRRNRA